MTVHKHQQGMEIMPTSERGLFREMEAEAERTRLVEQEQIKFRNALATVLSSYEGRQVIAWVLDITGMHETCSSRDAMAMMYRSARRDVGLDIEGEILDAGLRDAYRKLVEEHNGRTIERNNAD